MTGRRLLAWLKEHEQDFLDPSSSDSSLPALYADLAAHGGSNRAGFEASVAWWNRVLSKICMAGVQPTNTFPSKTTTKTTTSAERSDANGTRTSASGAASDRLTLHVNESLREALTLDEVGRPLGLGTVLMELHADAQLIPFATFLSSSAPLQGPSKRAQSLSARAASAALSPLVWAMSQVSLSLGFGDHDKDTSEDDWRKSKGDWVMWANVEAMADAIIAKHQDAPRLSTLESLFSLHTFKSSVLLPALSELDPDCQVLSDKDVQVILKHLTRDRKVALVSGDVVKMAQTADQDMSGATITESERGIVQVRDTHKKLELQVEEIEQRIKERQDRIERCVKEGSKAQAISYLRSRKALETLRDKRVGALETLHAVLIKIEQAASDVEVMKAYETSTASLKSLLQDERLQPDRIDASLEAMSDTVANADEVRDAIEVGQGDVRRAAGVPEMDDSEMEAELAALQKEVDEEASKKDKANENSKVQEEIRSSAETKSDAQEAQSSPALRDKELVAA